MSDTSPSVSEPKGNHSRRDRRIFLTLAGLGVVLILFFGLRVVRSFVRVRNMPPPGPSISVDEIKGWMPVGYLSRTFHVPPEDLTQGMGIPSETHYRTPLDEIARDYFEGSTDAAIAAARQAILDFQAAHPPAPPPPAPPRP